MAKGLLTFEALKNEVRNSGMFISDEHEKRMEGLVSSADKKQRLDKQRSTVDESVQKVNNLIEKQKQDASGELTG